MRLGDTIDDYCTRCKRETNHAIAAVVNNEVQKVLCQTCNTEHKYNHNSSPKKELTKEEAFQKVLDTTKQQMSGAAATSTPAKGKKKSTK